jgi:hypothetical protein
VVPVIKEKVVAYSNYGMNDDRVQKWARGAGDECEAEPCAQDLRIGVAEMVDRGDNGLGGQGRDQTDRRNQRKK